MAAYADVIVDIRSGRTDRVFQYAVPESMKDRIRVGSPVLVPFGSGGRMVRGIVTGFKDTPDVDARRIKSIDHIEEGQPSVDEQLVRLADWISRSCGGSMAQALRTVMPVKKNVKARQEVHYLIKDKEKAQAYLEQIRGDRRMKGRVRLLDAMLHREDLSISSRTASSVLRIAPGTLKALEQQGLISRSSRRIMRNPDMPFLQGWNRVELNEEQAAAVHDILACGQECDRQWTTEKAVHLIHGITGSGKTEVYMALIEKVLQQGRQVIVLIPEISLTLQTVSRFYDRFGDSIAVMNSRLSAGERYDQYLRAQTGEARIMIGPRSALFTPFSNLGMIIIDEEHEPSYKSETTPRYLAGDAAIVRAKLAGALVVMGSATPSLTSYSRALAGQYTLHELHRRAKAGSALPQVEIVDLREELRAGSRSMFSRKLHEQLEGCLKRGEQAMLFINRRGYAGFVSCRSCGYVVKCSHCDVSMTDHKKGLLKCHYCGSTRPMPRICPQCGSPYIASFGIGTLKVEEQLHREFPQARVLRMDRDTTAQKGSGDRILQEFAGGQADILIGTQMIVKGHDFENVTLVGVIAADLSLFSGDYLSSERTFQLLTQAAGRAGRSSRPGRVVIQTYQPDNYCITAAAAQDYRAFYDKEIKFRKAMHYPPACHMLMITAQSSSQARAREAAEHAAVLAHKIEHASVLGPTGAAIIKVKDMYRYVLYVRHERRRVLAAFMKFMEQDAAGQSRAFYSFDINPFSVL